MNLQEQFINLLGLTAKINDEMERTEIQENIINILQILQNTINVPYDFRKILENLKDDDDTMAKIERYVKDGYNLW